MEAGTVKITNFSKNLKKTFNWFNTQFTQKVENSAFDFWNIPVNCKLISVCENVSILAAQEEYFVTKIRLSKELHIFLRLSKKLVNSLLENSLGSNHKKFDMEKLTSLEAEILTGFNNFLFRNFSYILNEQAELPQNVTNYNECVLTFYFHDKDDCIGKAIVTIPVTAIKPELLEDTETETFTISDFTHSSADVKLKVGRTRIKLNDLKQLETGDIVVLEDSSIKRMTLEYDGNDIIFKVAPNPALIIDFENNGGKSMDDNSKNIYNMWDTIQVEMGAEFEKVKMSLGELKQISEGLVVDIGSVYDNKIDLKVEDKIIASGELVIINDRYGVQITQVRTEEKNNASNNAQLAEQPSALPAQSENESLIAEEPDTPAENEEEFDYSDFDIDEEDI